MAIIAKASALATAVMRCKRHVTLAKKIRQNDMVIHYTQDPIASHVLTPGIAPDLWAG